MKTLFIDSRELADKSRVATISNYFKSHDYNVKIETLKVGDYAIGEDKPSDLIGFEFKTRSDFFASFDKIKQQCLELSKTYQHPFLIIGSSLSDLIDNKGGFKTSSVFGMLGRIYSFKVSVIFAEFFYPQIMLKIIDKITDEKDSLGEYNPFRPSPNKKDWKVHNLASLPNISIQTAEKILEHFKTLKDFYNADLEELMKVEGIGEIKAKKILEVIR